MKSILNLNYENVSRNTFDNELVKFTNKKKKLQTKNKFLKKILINKNNLYAIKKKIKKNKNKINHNIVISSESNKANKIIINLKYNNVRLITQNNIPKNCHYFIIQDKEFDLWIKNKITFEEVLGTRRFRYERYPNRYDVKVNSADTPMPYSSFLENKYLPQVEDIVLALENVCYI